MCVFTCCSGDDSLRVKVSEEEAVDQGGFSKSRFTFLTTEENEAINTSYVSVQRTKEIFTVLQETRHLRCDAQKYTILDRTSAFIFLTTMSGGCLNNPRTRGKTASVYNQSAAFRRYKAKGRPLETVYAKL